MTIVIYVFGIFIVIILILKVLWDIENQIIKLENKLIELGKQNE